jgi:hypothetical protein
MYVQMPEIGQKCFNFYTIKRYVNLTGLISEVFLEFHITFSMADVMTAGMGSDTSPMLRLTSFASGFAAVNKAILFRS